MKITPDIHEALSGIQNQDRQEQPWPIEHLAEESMKISAKFVVLPVHV